MYFSFLRPFLEAPVDGGGTPQDTPPTPTPQTPPQSNNNIDYGKIQSMIDEATSRKENDVLKSYFQQQGMTEEEAKQAMEQFKANKQQQAQQQQVDLQAMQLQLQQAQELANKAEIDRLATMQAIELGIDAKTLPYVLKMADLSNIKGQDGKVNQEALKNALNKVLEDVPALKTQSKEVGTGFQLGANNNTQQQAQQNEDIRKMFGLSAKK